MKATTGPFSFTLTPSDFRAAPGPGNNQVTLAAPEYGGSLVMTIPEAQELLAKVQTAIQEAKG